MATVSRSELLNLHQEVCHTARELMKKKNHDYSGGEDETHPFLNFTRCESMGICTTEQGFLVRLTDKMSRLSTFCSSGRLKVEDEKLEDTILDVINYVILFYAYNSGLKD